MGKLLPFNVIRLGKMEPYGSFGKAITVDKAVFEETENGSFEYKLVELHENNWLFKRLFSLLNKK